jgi:hypothetical protein
MNNQLNQKQYSCALLLPKSKQHHANAFPAQRTGKRMAAQKLVEQGKRVRQAICVLVAGAIAVLAVVSQMS